MRYKIKLTLLLFCCSVFIADIAAQEQQDQTEDTIVRVAVMIPLYLDSAFSGNVYKLGDTYMPKYMLPGLDFYNGTMQAVAQLQQEHAKLEVWVYDTKSKTKGIPTVLSELKNKKISLILTSISGVPEQKAIATFALNNNIPVISVSYPNDAGLLVNPFFVLLNPTLKTHVEGIYDFVQKNRAKKKLLYIAKKGAMEDNIHNYFAAKNKGSQSLQYKKVLMEEPVEPTVILSTLDTTKQNMIVCGTLDENFAEALLQTLNTARVANAVTVVGMPSWSSSKKLSPENFPNIQMVSSSSFNYPKTDKLYVLTTKKYKEEYNTAPTDMVFRGYECMYRFCKLLLKYNTDFINHLSDAEYNITNTFYISPVFLDNKSVIPDYLENKKLYFIVKQGATIKTVE